MMGTKELLAADQNARDQIRNNIHTNYFVEAGAGSGKTSSLVDRMVTMVKGGLDVSRICAITFTKAAAGEFYSRFQEELSKAAATDEKCAEALKNIDLCFTGTIDSFCNMILSEHPTEAGIPSNASVISDEELTDLYRREYSLIQNGEYGSELQKECVNFKACYWNHEEVFMELLRMMLDNRNAEIVSEEVDADVLSDLLDEAEKQLKDMLLKIIEHPELSYEKQNASREAYAYLCDKKYILNKKWSSEAIDIISLFKKIEGLRLIPETDLSVLGMYSDGFFTLGGKKGGWYEIDKESDDYILTKLKKIQAGIALDFVKDCVDKIANKLKKEGKLNFFDYLLYLRDMLKTDAEGDHKLIKHIYERHSYFLIDEFQDTNPLQAEIFFYLTAKEPQSDWTKCVPQPGSLFIVGDPKQSIYRFRSADVASFSKVKALFTGDVGQVLYLSRNFRSTHPMNTWFNDVFKKMLPQDTENQSAFSEIPLEEAPEDDGTFRGVYYYESCNDKKADYAEQDASKVADIIERLVGNPNYLIREKENQEDAAIREITFKDFMVITPAKGKLPNYMKEFNARNIPFRVEGDVVFSDCPVLVLATRMFAALAHPGEKLYSTGLTELDKLEEAGIKIKNLSSVSLLNLIIEKNKLFEKSGSENLEILYFAMELLRDGEINGSIASLKDGAEFLQKLISGESREERSISLQKDENKVHIANLHKVKGLEAPIVILADPKMKDRKASIRVDHSGTNSKCWIFSAEKNFFPIFTNDSNDEEKALENEALAAESLRLLYVAATRARRVLIVGKGLTSKYEEAKGNPWKPFVDKADDDFFTLPKGKPGLIEERKTEKASKLISTGNTIFEDSSSAEKSYKILRPSQIKVKGKTDDSEFEDADTEEASRERTIKNPALVGTMVHKLMESLVTSGGKVRVDDLAKEIIIEYDYHEADGCEMLIEIGQKILGGGYAQDNGVAQDILKELLSAEEVYCEVPFCYQLPETEDDSKITPIWNGVMDVIYRKDGKWHIVDYKTNLDPSDLDKKYQAQLAAYIDAFKEMTGEEADALIYHIEV